MELQRKLKTWGYDVPSFAFSRKEAVKKAKEIKPDLILMDVMLKGQGDGIDAATEIKNIQDIPIIYLTAYGDSKTRKRLKSPVPLLTSSSPLRKMSYRIRLKLLFLNINLKKSYSRLEKLLMIS